MSLAGEPFFVESRCSVKKVGGDVAPIVVFGSAHLDVYARAGRSPVNFKDKPGHVSFYVGGSGFNLAKWLALLGEEVALFTYLPRHSFISAAIRSEISDAGINDEFVFSDEQLQPSGFVALLIGARVEQAVSSISIEHASFDSGLVEEAVSIARFVIIECNLSVDQIGLITAAASRNAKEVVVSPVSAAKAGRYLEASVAEDMRFALVSLNKVEAAFMLKELPEDLDRWVPQQMLKRFRARNLIVSLGPSGHVLITDTGTKRFFAPLIGNAQGGSELGAGDALLAAHCKYLIPNGPIDSGAAAALARKMVTETFSYLSATPEH